VIKSFVLILHVMNPTGESTFALDFGSNTDCLESALEWSYTLDEFSYMTCEVETLAPTFSD